MKSRWILSSIQKELEYKTNHKNGNLSLEIKPRAGDLTVLSTGNGLGKKWNFNLNFSLNA